MRLPASANSMNTETPGRRPPSPQLRGVEHRIAEDGYAREWPDNLLEQLQLLAAQLRQIEEHARDVAARLCQVTHESHRHGITLQVDGHDGNPAGRLLGSRQRSPSPRYDDIH